MTAETSFIIHAFYMGAYITFIYDVLRMLRRVLPHSGFFVSLEDIGFWIYCAVKVFLLMYYESNGNLRWFAICSAVGGMYLYLKLISPLWLKYASFMCRIIEKQLLRMVKIPARHIFRMLRRLKKQLTYFGKILKINLKGR